MAPHELQPHRFQLISSLTSSSHSLDLWQLVCGHQTCLRDSRGAAVSGHHRSPLLSIIYYRLQKGWKCVMGSGWQRVTTCLACASFKKSTCLTTNHLVDLWRGAGSLCCSLSAAWCTWGFAVSLVICASQIWGIIRVTGWKTVCLVNGEAYAWACVRKTRTMFNSALKVPLVLIFEGGCCILIKVLGAVFCLSEHFLWLLWLGFICIHLNWFHSLTKQKHFRQTQNDRFWMQGAEGRIIQCSLALFHYT